MDQSCFEPMFAMHMYGQRKCLRVKVNLTVPCSSVRIMFLKLKCHVFVCGETVPQRTAMKNHMHVWQNRTRTEWSTCKCEYTHRLVYKKSSVLTSTLEISCTFKTSNKTASARAARILRDQEENQATSVLEGLESQQELSKLGLLDCTKIAVRQLWRRKN